jgi:antirestriction protein ArdC
MAQKFEAPIWMTYRQAQDFGGQVRKGEKGSPVVYANAMTKTATDAATGDEVEKSIRFLRGYTVFNVEQIDGLPAHYYAPPVGRLAPHERIARAERFFAATGTAIAHGGSRAFYRSSTDSIHMPPFQAFDTAESYYATLGHETIHWTGHESRLARDFTGGAQEGGRPARKGFGSEAYTMEELVAELGSAFLCSDLDLVVNTSSNDAGALHAEHHTSYIANWLTVLKNDKRAIFTAASHAQRAADYLDRAGAGAPALAS